MSGIGAKRMHGHSGKSAAPARKKLCGQDGLTCSGPRRQAASRLAPTTSPPARWRAYMAAAVRRQACCDALLIDIVGYSGPSADDSFLTHDRRAAQESINQILCRFAGGPPTAPSRSRAPRQIILSRRIGGGFPRDSTTGTGARRQPRQAGANEFAGCDGDLGNDHADPRGAVSAGIRHNIAQARQRQCDDSRVYLAAGVLYRSGHVAHRPSLHTGFERSLWGGSGRARGSPDLSRPSHSPAAMAGVERKGPVPPATRKRDLT